MKTVWKIGFYPYEDLKGKTLNQYTHNVEKALSKTGKIVPFYHMGEGVNNLFRYDAIFLNWFENELTFGDRVFLILARICGKKIVWTFHNRVSHDSENAAKSIKNICFLMKVSTQIMVLSKNSIPYVYELTGKKRWIRKKIMYVPHINYCENYLPRKKNINKPKEFIYLYFGQIRPYKNLEMLIEAFQKINESGSKLVIAGKPFNAVYAKKIKAMCGNDPHIELDFRFIEDWEVYDYMSGADAVVLPYDKKSSMNSGAMIAAFSCKKPVIVPDIAMAKDYKNCKFCMMYKYESETQHMEQLGNAMKMAYRYGKEENRLLGEAAYQYVKKNNNGTLIAEILKIRLTKERHR